LRCAFCATLTLSNSPAHTDGKMMGAKCLKLICRREKYAHRTLIYNTSED
jgi:hypothetical protein